MMILILLQLAIGFHEDKLPQLWNYNHAEMMYNWTIGMGDTSTNISISILKVLDIWVSSTFLKESKF